MRKTGVCILHTLTDFPNLYVCILWRFSICNTKHSDSVSIALRMKCNENCIVPFRRAMAITKTPHSTISTLAEQCSTHTQTANIPSQDRKRRGQVEANAKSFSDKSYV